MLLGSLLPPGILTFIDSTIPEIWLLIAVSTIFESAFGLRYDATTDRHFVNDTIHANLTSMNPTTTFTLGNDISGGETVSLDFPYAALDLQASWPIYANATNYFPLRRAANSTQYRLERIFLQETCTLSGPFT